MPEPTFDAKICDAFQEASKAVLLAHPELRSVGIVLDYHGTANDSPTSAKAVWISETGTVSSPDAILGSLRGTLLLAQHQLQRSFELYNALVRDMIQVGQTLVAAQEPSNEPHATMPEGAAAQTPGDGASLPPDAD